MNLYAIPLLSKQVFIFRNVAERIKGRMQCYILIVAEYFR